ncbi:hypothetical protein B5E58_11080 [Tyzzerella sp. An114]|uniref:transcriptional regulator n=1 Tax=Tyzzerella sp. An114 TaxID=1965545 RepID=UPI000B43DA19|nr:transcriptional regulator [Tyzzerella sp. An114]OUQ56210.1 hypothetical protein B5E58_11080 [Tyzzerella sp. An114]
MKYPTLLTVDDVMEITRTSRGMAYKLISKINAELKSQGYITVRGKVPRKKFFERLGIEE